MRLHHCTCLWMPSPPCSASPECVLRCMRCVVVVLVLTCMFVLLVLGRLTQMAKDRVKKGKESKEAKEAKEKETQANPEEEETNAGEAQSAPLSPTAVDEDDEDEEDEEGEGEAVEGDDDDDEEANQAKRKAETVLTKTVMKKSKADAVDVTGQVKELRRQLARAVKKGKKVKKTKHAKLQTEGNSADDDAVWSPDGRPGQLSAHRIIATVHCYHSLMCVCSWLADHLCWALTSNGYACNKSLDCFQHRDDDAVLKSKFEVAPKHAVMKKYIKAEVPASPAQPAVAPAVAAAVAPAPVVAVGPVVRGDVAVTSLFEYPVIHNAVRLRSEKKKAPIVCLFQDANLSLSKVGGCYCVGKLQDGVKVKTFKYEAPEDESSDEDFD